MRKEALPVVRLRHIERVRNAKAVSAAPDMEMPAVSAKMAHVTHQNSFSGRANDNLLAIHSIGLHYSVKSLSGFQGDLPHFFNFSLQ